ncbi:hypothetical protein BWZ22_04040 [Seonamhaeicola sp. S2-3]|uniref:DUF7793 family protein n=1 Tax=Seonamhaeicola sp. S2-3 TaxID=1936081 RepID=UPI000972BC90|nr:hypothetical protein [Seonamhaeicola sp. S2-3]APY10460.1 hypothetical protein BWZ22_04040 [Seonamhaeicola sp. S2-3]
MCRYFENDYSSYRLEGGILHVTYHNRIYIDLDAAIRIVDDRIALHEGRALPVLCDVRSVAGINKPARHYLAIEGSTLIRAVAFLVEPAVSEAMSQFYIRTSYPPIPTRSFKKKEEALKFLRPFVEGKDGLK